jgi:selenocysteine lyase/cysteine desulfurase
MPAKSWRADFPVLDQHINGHSLTYLDSAATTQRPTSVVDALLDFYRHDNANPGSSLHALARRAYERYESARRTIATFILGPRAPAQRVPVFSFVSATHSPEEILRHLDDRGIAIRAGDLAALPLLKRFGVNAAARASCYLYTQADDIDRLIAALRELTRRSAKDLR